ncbi:diacylglycerol/lipid kinase family protein [Parapedobacter indicus]|uniref:Diacylglycerol kinase family enzyme n=1 Tax=Parapedobacter indicus TaxID=1477437 RepID=A0A1I3DQU8_9SPHI|nr:diacylglycerol kinase family protein [Parapedobacter indicus]PPL04802.1 diacylglycerol kinase family enzyme [Parapedobacter indicus]SFH89095.1 Diacylglycerol kinase family enzyme [Parapedobacter indicus]
MQAAKHAQLLHNPKAGDGDHMREDLIQTVASCGFTCGYVSTKAKGWDRLKNKTLLVVIAGGDGTVRQVLKRLLRRRILDKRLVVALLPAGTANNFAKTLGIPSSLSGLKRAIMSWQVKKIDIGAIGNLSGAKFFLEGMGCGLLPRLIKEMKTVDLSGVETADEELTLALDKLIEISQLYKPKRSTLTIDGIRYEDSYLLVEVLNIRSVGPNVVLAPKADPTDGKFQVALLKEADREAFITYLGQLRRPQSGRRPKVPWQLVEVSCSLTLRCENRLLHVDDELIDLKESQLVKVEVRQGIVDIIV